MKKLLFSAIFAFSCLFVSAQTFTADATKSTFKWTGKKVTGQHWGYIKLKDGSFVVEKGMLKGGMFTIDMNTFDVQDIPADKGGAKLLGHLQSDDFFGVANNPTSTLKIKSATAKGNGAYDVVADITIKGVTSEVAFPATVTVTGKVATVSAALSVNRTKHGIKYGSGSFFENLGDKAINDDFTVDVNVSAMAAEVPAAARKATTSKTTSSKAKTTKPAKKPAAKASN